MKAAFSLITALAASTALAAPASAAESRIVERGGYTLDFRDPPGTTDQAVADRMVETFFAVYPQLVTTFNPDAPTRVTFIMDPDLPAVAGVGGDVVMYHSGHFAAHPHDIDVVTHEVMHVVQAYGDRGAPGWLTEGIADYVRHVYGVDNAAGGWALPDFSPDQSLEDGYRGVGRFLLWLETHGHAGVVRALDSRLRAGTWSDEAWVELTGRTLPTLWADYAASPAL